MSTPYFDEGEVNLPSRQATPAFVKKEPDCDSRSPSPDSYINKTEAERTSLIGSTKQATNGEHKEEPKGEPKDEAKPFVNQGELASAGRLGAAPSVRCDCSAVRGLETLYRIISLTNCSGRPDVSLISKRSYSGKGQRSLRLRRRNSRSCTSVCWRKRPN